MNPVTFHDVLYQAKNGKWYYQSQELTVEQLETLVSQAESMENLWLWKILANSGTLNAQTRMAMAKSGDDKKDLAQVRQAQEYVQVISDFEDLLRKLKLSSSRRKTDREQSFNTVPTAFKWR